MDELLREKIAKKLCLLWFIWNKEGIENDPQVNAHSAECYWDGLNEKERQMWLPDADQVETLIKEQYVKLAADQRTMLLSESTMAGIRPDIFDGSLDIGEYGHQKWIYGEYAKPIEKYLLDAGFRRVE